MSTTLHDHHRRELHASGLTDATIAACGFYSEDSPSRLTAILQRRYPKRRGSALVIPFPDTDGNLNGFSRLKPDSPRADRNGRKIKYESPAGVGNRAFFPPGTREVLDEPAAELLIAEGEKKAAKADQEGYRCIGLVGVYGWKDGKGVDRLIPDLEAVAWRGRRVFIVYDSDLADKPEVREAESRLAQQLVNRGAKVKVCRLPDGTGGAKQGLDDFLIANEPIELRKLLDKAEDPDPVTDRSDKLPASQLDAMPEARRFIKQVCTRDKKLLLRCWREDFYGYDGAKYVRLTTDEMQSRLMQWLDPGVSHLTRSAVQNVLACVRAETLLPASVEMPHWLTRQKCPLPQQCLVAANGILSVPGDAEPTLLNPTPDLFTCNALEFEYRPNAGCPDWLAFLDMLWPDDPQSIDTLQEIFGYLLFPETRQQKMFMLLGPKRSGKGTIARIFKHVAGPQNVCAPRLGSLAGDFGLQPLLGKTIAIIGDARLSGRTDSASIVETLLSITGEDPATINRKHQTAVDCTLPVRFLLLSNELPRLTDASATLPSRMILLRLRESFYGREDPGLTDLLKAEAPGILNWALAGWRRLQQRGYFVQPESSRELLDDLETLSSPVTAFVREQCVVQAGRQTPIKLVFAAWKQWCEDKGRKPGSEQVFGRDIRAAVPTISVTHPRDEISGKPVRHYEGLGLTADAH